MTNINKGNSSITVFQSHKSIDRKQVRATNSNRGKHMNYMRKTKEQQEHWLQQKQTHEMCLGKQEIIIQKKSRNIKIQHFLDLFFFIFESSSYFHILRDQYLSNYTFVFDCKTNLLIPSILTFYQNMLFAV